MKTIEDIILDDPLFASLKTGSNDYDNMPALLAERGITLPPFVVLKNKPAPLKVGLLENGNFTVEGYDAEWDSLEELYDSRTEELNFTEEITNSPQVYDRIGQMILLNDMEREGTRRGLLGHDPDEDNVEMAYDYYRFLVAARAWFENRADFFTSFEFLIHHPAFWHLHKSTHPEMDDQWVTDDGLTNMNIFTFVSDEDGKHYVGLEAGGVVRPDNTRFWRNDGMNIARRTMDEAYIALADAVDKQYDLAGVPRASDEPEGHSRPHQRWFLNALRSFRSRV